MRITIRQGAGAGRIIVVDRPLTLGREADVDIVLEDALISSRHATLSPNADGSVELTDLSSTNGTYVNDVKVAGGITLRGGERIRMGKVQLDVEGTVVESPGGTAVAGGREGGTRLAGSGNLAPKLVISGGPSAGQIIELTADGTLVIGRDADCDIRIDDPEVSSRHASVTRAGDTITVADLRSLNGTRLNGSELHGQRPLATGDRIAIGPATIQLEGAGAPAANLTVVRTAPVATPLAGQAKGPEPIPSQPFQPGRQAQQPVARASRNGRTVAAAIAVVAAVGIGVAAFLVLRDDGGGSTSAKPVPLSEKDLIAANRDATVQVITTMPDTNQIGAGSGSVIDAKAGLVITNNHVAGGAATIGIRADGASAVIPVDLVASAPCEDLALLKIRNPSDLAKFAKQVSLGQSSELAQGDRLVALGFPAESDAARFEQIPLAATDGIVSKVETVSGLVEVPLKSVIQHTAPINHGNSGGPLFDDLGRQVGVNTFHDPDLAEAYYSVTSSRLLEVLPKMKTGWSPAWIGADLETVADSQQRPVGVQLGSLVPFGPADTAKLLPGLVIVAVNRRTVNSLTDYCAQMPAEPGTPVDITTSDPQTGALVTWTVTPGKK